MGRREVQGLRLCVQDDVTWWGPRAASHTLEIESSSASVVFDVAAGSAGRRVSFRSLGDELLGIPTSGRYLMLDATCSAALRWRATLHTAATHWLGLPTDPPAWEAEFVTEAGRRQTHRLRLASFLPSAASRGVAKAAALEPADVTGLGFALDLRGAQAQARGIAAGAGGGTGGGGQTTRAKAIRLVVHGVRVAY